MSGIPNIPTFAFTPCGPARGLIYTGGPGFGLAPLNRSLEDLMIRLASPYTACLVAAATFGLGMFAAYAVGNNGVPGFFGSFACENFGLPDKSYTGLVIDRELKVYGTGDHKRQVHVGRLDLRNRDVANLEFARETLADKGFPLNPLAEYIVDNAGDALLILEMQGERARTSFICRRN